MEIKENLILFCDSIHIEGVLSDGTLQIKLDNANINLLADELKDSLDNEAIELFIETLKSK